MGLTASERAEHGSGIREPTHLLLGALLGAAGARLGQGAFACATRLLGPRHALPTAAAAAAALLSALAPGGEATEAVARHAVAVKATASVAAAVAAAVVAAVATIVVHDGRALRLASAAKLLMLQLPPQRSGIQQVLICDMHRREQPARQEAGDSMTLFASLSTRTAATSQRALLTHFNGRFDSILAPVHARQHGCHFLAREVELGMAARAARLRTQRWPPRR